MNENTNSLLNEKADAFTRELATCLRRITGRQAAAETTESGVEICIDEPYIEKDNSNDEN